MAESFKARLQAGRAADGCFLEMFNPIAAEIVALKEQLCGMQRRADLAEGREVNLRAMNADERGQLLREIESGKTLRKGLEAQVSAMRAERRNQVIGYCAEMARWDAHGSPMGNLWSPSSNTASQALAGSAAYEYAKRDAKRTPTKPSPGKH